MDEMMCPSVFSPHCRKLVAEFGRIADVDRAGVEILVLVPRRRGDLREDVERVLEDVLRAVVGGVLGLLLEEDAAARVLRVGDRDAIRDAAAAHELLELLRQVEELLPRGRVDRQGMCFS